MNEYIWAIISFFSGPLGKRFPRGLNNISTGGLRVLQKDNPSSGKWRPATKYEITGEKPVTDDGQMIVSLQSEINTIKRNQQNVTEIPSVQNLLTSYDKQINSIENNLNVNDLTVLFENRLAG